MQRWILQTIVTVLGQSRTRPRWTHLDLGLRMPTTLSLWA